MPYTVDRIQTTIQRLLGKTVSKATLRGELDRVIWEPELDRMIAVSNAESELAGSERYGVFRGMSNSGDYLTSAGKAAHARPLTVVEIAKCF